MSTKFLFNILSFLLVSSGSAIGQSEYLYHFYEWNAEKTEYSAGYINNKGEVIVKPQYEDANNFYEGLASVRSRKNLKWGYINTRGKVVIPFIYDVAKDFENGVAIVGLKETNYKYNGIPEDGILNGVINHSGLKVFPLKYSVIGNFINEITIATSGDDDKFKRSVLHKDGKVIHTEQNQSPNVISDSLIVVSKNGKKGLIDILGNNKLPYLYDHISRSSDGMVLVFKEETHAVLNLNGNNVLPFDKEAYQFLKFSPNRTLISQKKEDQIILYDDKGQIVFSIEADGVHPLKEGLISYKKNGLWGAVDYKGKQIFPSKYLSISYFHDGLAVVQDPITEKFGYIDIKGNLVINYQFQSAFEFRGGAAMVWSKLKFSYIDKRGKLLRPFN